MKTNLKRYKKLTAIMLAVVLSFTSAIPAAADEREETTVSANKSENSVQDVSFEMQEIDGVDFDDMDLNSDAEITATGSGIVNLDLSAAGGPSSFPVLKYKSSIPDAAFRDYLESTVFPQMYAAIQQKAAAGDQASAQLLGLMGNAAVDADSFPFSMDTLLMSLGQSPVGEDIVPIAVIYAVPGLDLSNKNVSSIEGIQYFTGITKISISGNNITSADFTSNTALTAIDASHNKLTSINVSKCPDLTALNVMNNKLTALDISNNKKITQFACTFNAISLLDFRGNTVIDPFDSTKFNVAFQSGDLVILCDPGSAMEKYCKIYGISYAYSMLPARPTVSTASENQVVVVKEKVNLAPIIEKLAGDKKITKYSVSPKGFASINNKGVLKGKKAGDAVITAYTGSGSSRTAVVEYPITIAKVAFSEKTVESVSMGAVISAESYITGIKYRPDSWMTSNKNVAEIDAATGQITVKGRGNAKITALYGSGKNAARITFKLKAIIPTLNKTKLYLKVGKSAQLKLKKTKKTPVWVSTDTSVVAVGSTTGQITGINHGTAKVIAYLDYGTPEQTEYICKVTVVE